MIRRLRIAASVFFAVLTVALCVLWVRSYWRIDGVHIFFRSHVFEAWSAAGEIHWGHDFPVLAHGADLIIDSRAISPPRTEFWVGSDGKLNLSTSFGYRASYGHYGYLYSVPHWFLVLVSAIIASIAWWPPRLVARFSLRTMLVAVMLVAVLLGLGIWIIA
jgi:hypothetical protein